MNQLGPSNGGVKGNLDSRVFLGLQKNHATFEGLGFLGKVI